MSYCNYMSNTASVQITLKSAKSKSLGTVKYTMQIVNAFCTCSEKVFCGVLKFWNCKNNGGGEESQTGFPAFLTKVILFI
jgi:hypothetical protein